ncbi:MAG: maleylacetoacetate isomerase [Roseibium sp.]
MAREIVLYDYWRSSASYRVRIALNLLGLEAGTRPVNLLTGSHLDRDYLELNPQGLLPALMIDGKTLTQSLAIIEYLHATTPGSMLPPADIDGQYRVRQLAYAIAMEIHPVCNLGVVKHVAQITGGGDAARADWMRHFIGKGLGAFEALLDDAGPFCRGDTPTMADCCLIPQLYNAERWGVDISGFARIGRAAEAASRLEAFRAAHPDVIGPPPE